MAMQDIAISWYLLSIIVLSFLEYVISGLPMTCGTLQILSVLTKCSDIANLSKTIVMISDDFIIPPF